MNEPLLQTRALGKAYGRRVALDELELAITPGELVALVGENGAGKTTTIAMLSGQLVPDRGQALLGGHDVYREPIAARRLLGYVAQDLLLPPYLTLLELAELVCAIKQVALDEPALQRLLTLTGLQGDADRLVGELSHGMQRKAAWVIALVTTPSVLLLDEGLAGLDATSSAALVAEVSQRLRARQVAALWAEHDLTLLAAHLSRVVVLHAGRVAEVVDGDALREHAAAGRLAALQRSWTTTPASSAAAAEDAVTEQKR